jgi:hypothetical protein
MLCYARSSTEKVDRYALEFHYNLLELFAWRNAGRGT